MNGRYAITGGGSGIGRAVAERLSAAGAEVAILDIDPDAASAVADAVRGTAHTLDVGDPDRVDSVFEQIGAIRGLVNCAGAANSTPIVSTSTQEWKRLTGINLDGTFYCLRAGARSMLRHHVADGTIVSIASINASFTHRGLAGYAASKGAIVTLTKVAALELAASGIRVNAVAPGIVYSGMTADILEDPAELARWNERIPLGRMGRADDIADVVAFLSDSESRWITGQTLHVDGGQSLRVEPSMTSDDLWEPDSLRAAIIATE